MIDLQLQTYWNVETLYVVFNAVASYMGGASFEGMMRYVFLFAVALGLFAYLGSKQLEFGKWFIQALMFVTVLNLPIARVILTDKAGLEAPRTVSNVPFALAVIAQSSNLVFGSLASAYETVFGVPDDMGLAKGDLGFGHKILKQVGSATIQDPGLRADIMQFIKECTLYDIKDGSITPQQIVGGTDVWDTIFDNSSPARFVTHETLTPNPVTDTCDTTGKTILKPRVVAAVTAAQTFYGKQAFPRASSDAIATSLFVSSVGTSYDWILNNSQNASDAMRQAMFNNIWREAGAELPALLNDPARVAEVNAMAGAAQAARQANGSNSTMALLGQETLPHMRNWIEAILYAIFPIIVVMTVVVSAEGAKKILGGYMMSVAWIGMWPVLFAVLNHLSLMLLQQKVKALGLASGVPFQLSDAFDATLGDEQAMIGYMVVLVPFIAGAIIKMGQGGFMSVADRMITGFAAAGQNIGSQMASGNHSSGQVGMDTAAVNNTSMHKYDSNIGLTSGGKTFGLGSGGSATLAANGTVSMQQMQNRMLSSLGLDRKFESTRSQESHDTQITSRGDQDAYRHSDASSLSQIRGRDNQRGSHQHAGVEVAETRQGTFSGTAGGRQSISKDSRDSSTWGERAGAEDRFDGRLGVGTTPRGPAATGGSAPAGGMGAPNAKDEKRIISGMKEAGATQPEIDQALTNFRSSQRGGAPAQGPSRGGPILDAGLGVSTAKTYTAGHSKDKSASTQHVQDEHAQREYQYQNTGSRNVQRGDGEQSSQTSREAAEASKSNVDERSRVRDVSDRSELGVGNRANRSETDSFNMHRDMMADPQLFSKVAARNGMSSMRFANQSEDRIVEMVQDYLNEKGFVQASKNLNATTFNGDTLPTNKQDLNSQSKADRKDLPSNIDEKHREKVAQTGAGSVGPVSVDTKPPAIVGQAEGYVDGKLDPTNKDSIPAKTSGFDKTVHDWASPDKQTGEARANPMGRVEEIEKADVKDYANKVWDVITGGDGINYKKDTTPSADYGPAPSVAPEPLRGTEKK